MIQLLYLNFFFFRKFDIELNIAETARTEVSHLETQRLCVCVCVCVCVCEEVEVCVW